MSFATLARDILGDGKMTPQHLRKQPGKIEVFLGVREALSPFGEGMGFSEARSVITAPFRLRDGRQLAVDTVGFPASFATPSSQ